MMFPNGSSHGHLGYLLLAVQYIQTPADLHHTASEHQGSQGQGLSDRKQELESCHTPGQLIALPASPVLLRTCIFLHSSLHQRSWCNSHTAKPSLSAFSCIEETSSGGNSVSSSIPKSGRERRLDPIVGPVFPWHPGGKVTCWNTATKGPCACERERERDS